MQCIKHNVHIPYIGHGGTVLLQNPMDIRDAHGVHINKLPGSRVEYNPFPGGFKIIPG